MAPLFVSRDLTPQLATSEGNSIMVRENYRFGLLAIVNIYFEYFSMFKDSYPVYLPKGYEGSKHNSLIQKGPSFQS